MRIQFGIVHCLWLTVVLAIVFSTLQLSRATAQSALLLEIWLGFHVMLAMHQNCYAAIHVGVVAAFVAGLFFPHASGTWFPGRPWIEMLMPYQLISMAAMLSVGGFAQTLFARSYLRERDQAARNGKRRAQRYQFRDPPP